VPTDPTVTEPGLSLPAPESSEPVEAPAVQPEKPYIPRKVYLKVSDFERFGHTPGCRGCESIIMREKYRVNHNAECRARIIKALSEDEDGQRRLREAEDKENAFLAGEIEKSDLARKALAADVEMTASDMPGRKDGGEPSSSTSAPIIRRVRMPETEGGSSGSKDTGMDLSLVLDAISGIERKREWEQRNSVLCSLGAVSVAEVYSPPRVTARAQFHGLSTIRKWIQR